MARVKLIQDRDDVAPEHYALFDELAALRGRISGPSTVVLHSPGLARPWNEISEYLHRDSIVAPADAELAVSATAREKDCPYVWNAHVPAARKAGVSEATIAAVRERRPIDALPASETLVVRYVQQLMQRNRVESDVFDALLAAHDPKWMIELTVWIGRYAALAGILNGFEVAAANPVETLPVDGPTSARPPVGPVRVPSAAPRVPPVTGPEQLAEADRPLFDALADRTGGGIARPFMAYSPRLAQRVFDVSDWLRSECEIAPALRELAALAVAREKDAPAVWASHVDLARRHGGSEEAITAVRDRGTLDALPPDERDVIDYVRQQLRTHRVTQDLFDRLRDHHGVRWLVELTCLVGHYGVVTSVVNAFELTPPAGADPLPLG
jgi:4-carboxymuconolactone decarboxylase